MIDTAAIPFATKAASSTAHKRRFGQKLTSVTLAVVIITTVTAQPAGYGERLLPAPKCLTSRSTVSGVGRMQFCLDVEGPATTGQKVVVSVTTPRPTDIVLFGERALPISSADQSSSSSSIIGPIIEIKPFEQSCETCDFCPCLGPGCGTRCECSCNVMCRLRREATCAHTAGVLTPGRWFVSVDAPGAFTLEATLVGALVLSPGAPALRRTVFAAGAPAGSLQAPARESLSLTTSTTIPNRMRACACRSTCCAAGRAVASSTCTCASVSGPRYSNTMRPCTATVRQTPRPCSCCNTIGYSTSA